MVSRPMKESGVEWIGEIPKNWITAKLLNFLKRPITDGPHETPNYAEEGVPFISVNAIDWQGNINRNVNTFITEEDARKYNEKINLEVGDILFTKSATIGKMAIVDEVDFMVWSPIAVIKPKDGIDNNFLKFIFQCNGYLDYVSNLGTKNTQVNVGMRAMEKAKISVPSALEEQQKIASFLDEKVSHIDSILEDTKKSIEDLKAYKQSLITETVTKGLNANVEMKDTGIEWIGQIPKHWVLSKIKYRVSLRNEKDPYKIGDKYIGLEHIESNNGRIHSYDEDYNGGLTDKFKSGDVLFSKLRPYLAKGFIASFDGYCSGELLTFKDVEGDKRYLLYYILSENFIDAINASTYGTKMPRANWDYIKELPIPCFPIYEQQVIAGFLDEKTSHIDSLIRNKKKMLQEIEAYKKSLIYEYVTGKKEVK